MFLFHNSVFNAKHIPNKQISHHFLSHSKLVEMAANGEPFVIAKAGKPMVKVMPLGAAEPGQEKRFGFMTGQIAVPADFDNMASAEIAEMFNGEA